MRKTCWNFEFAFQKVLEMFDSLMKFRYVSKAILINFDKFVQFIKIQAEGSFWKNFRKSNGKFKKYSKNCWTLSELWRKCDPFSTNQNAYKTITDL